MTVRTTWRHAVLAPRWVLPLVFVIAMPWILPNDFRLHTAIMAVLYLLIAIGLNIAMGYAGVLSLGHAAFALVGAYTAALTRVHWGWPYWEGALLAVAICVLIGIVTAIPVLRLGGFAVAIVTIFYVTIATRIVFHFRSVTGGGDGVAANPSALDLSVLWWLYVAITIALWVGSRNLLLSPTGRAWRITRLSPVLAGALSIPVNRMKVVAFAISAAFAGLAGSLWPPLNGYTNVEPFSIWMGILIVLIVIVGGEGTVYGPLLGTLVMTGIPVVLNEAFSSGGNRSQFVYGALLLAVVRVLPDGLAGAGRALRDRFRRQSVAPPDATGDDVTGSAQPSSTAPALVRSATRSDADALVVEDVRKSIGGVTILDGVSLTVQPGEIHGLVGPNGSGKTTMLNVVSGFLGADAGSIVLGGAPLLGPAHARAKAGISRTFQHPMLLEDFSTYENVLVGADASLPLMPLSFTLRTPRARRATATADATVREWLEAVGLPDDLMSVPAKSLTGGQRRQVEIARAAAARPHVLLMDEPAVGLGSEEREALAATVARLASQGIAVVLVDHNVDLVFGLCDKLTVLDAGSTIMTGTPVEARRDPRVAAAYLGDAGAAVSAPDEVVS